MSKGAGSIGAALLALLLGTAALGLHACGGGGHDRDRERCETCNPADIDGDCLEECEEFCSDSETAAECDARCQRQCDQCKDELRCTSCIAGCTGTESRCAPLDETLTCEDGQF